MSTAHKQFYLKLILLGLITTTGGLQLLSSSSNQITEEQSEDLASKISGDTKRSTKLGVAVPKDNNFDKEFEILLKDPAMSNKWGLVMTNSQKAWQVSKGSKDIVVAIIDTGADVQHPDLKKNIWVNKNEIPGNGRDDDQNGFVDDVNGWNFVGNNSNLTDNHGHGTHIAGIVGAEGGNGIGVTGVAPQVSLMILKYYDPKSPGINNLSNTVRAIEYAVKMGANIINYSGGGLEASPEEKRAIELANKKGILFIGAAGNERSNSDEKAYYPADYELSNIISVTAIDKGKNVLPTSNWGVRTVDIAAPGNDIYSTLPNGQYGYMTGTSQATAFVTGVAALIMAKNSELRKAESMVKYLTQTGDIDQRLDGKTRFARRLNSYRALAIQDGDLSFAGTRAQNVGNLAKHAFAADPANRNQAQAEAPAEQLAIGGRAIMDFIEQASGHVPAAVGTPNDQDPQL